MDVVDGASGEGGGQILRTALAVSALTGRPVTVRNIRAGRRKPGLLRQHLCCVRAAAAISDAEVDGDALGSDKVCFRPRKLRGGSHHFAVGSAGSVHLVLQTILLPLLAADRPCEITIDGGTHNLAAPSFDFVAHSLLPTLRSMGAEVEIELVRWGFHPAGGGRVRVTTRPGLPRLTLDRPAAPADVRFRAEAVVCNLAHSIAERELAAVDAALPLADRAVRKLRGPGPGNVVTVRVDAPRGPVFTAFGRRGRTAEQVGREVACAARAWLQAGVSVDAHLADQLLLPMAIGAGGRFTTTEPSLHTRTNAALLEQLLAASVTFERDASEKQWWVAVRPR